MRRRHFDRRDFLRWSAVSLTAAGFCGMPPFLRRTLSTPLMPGRKLLFIFLRGGIDAVQAVIPYGDRGLPGKPTYLSARPTLGEPPAAAHDLNGFASLNPNMQSNESAGSPRLADIFHGSVDDRGPGLAVLHRIGYSGQNRSHFSSQQFWENGNPADTKLEKGVFNNYISAYPDPGTQLRAATIDSNQMVMMKGDTLIPVLRSVEDFALPSNVDLGVSPTAASPLGAGLKGAYGQTGSPAPYCPLTYSTGATLLETLQFFEDNVRSAPYEPEPDARPYYDAIESRRFAAFVRDCARLLKQVDSLQIVGCNQGGYDTHGSEDARFPALSRDLARALTALYHDLKPIWDRTLVVTMSEFGRTSMENGNRGTDHGESTCMFAMGGPVDGGVYNCDRDTWADGDLFSTPNGRYVAHRTDFRNVYHEIIARHLGDPENRIDRIIPDYTAAASADTNGYFTPLGFLSV